MESVNQPITSPAEPAVMPPGLETPPETAAAEPAVAGETEPAHEVTAPSPRRIVSDFGGDVITSLQSLMGTIVIAIFVITFIVQAFQIPSESMEETLLVGDYLLVNKLCYGGHGLSDYLMPYQKVSRGDVIVFHYPVDPRQHFVKRVIGIPGDRVRLVKKAVYINGQPLKESYVHFIEPPGSVSHDPSILFRDDFPRTDIPVFNMEWKWWLEMRKLVEDGELIVPDGQYFVMGDNRDDSQDSRYWGFVPRENIIGRPLLIYWSVKTESDPPPGTVYRFAYAVTHVFQNTRWNRTLRLIH